MKNLFIVFIGGLLLALAACTNSSANNATGNNNAQQANAATLTTAEWTDSLQNFGTVEKGKQVKIVFHVKNTGDHPLFITSARPSCGCTVADYTKSAIPAGETGEVTANFDSNRGMAKYTRPLL
jgi:major membrane immunogen (membrane-anchored lipoprotein)